MNFDIELYHEGVNLNDTTPIHPSDILEVTVSAEEELKGIKIQIYDPKGNMRVMSRRKGNSAKFQTRFLDTKQEGVWAVKITGYGKDGTIDSDTEYLLLKLEKEKSQTPPSLVDQVIKEGEEEQEEKETIEVTHDLDIDDVKPDESIQDDMDREAKLSSPTDPESSGMFQEEETQPSTPIDISTDTIAEEMVSEEGEISEESEMFTKLDDNDDSLSSVLTGSPLTNAVEEATSDDIESSQLKVEASMKVSLTKISGVGKATAIKLEAIGITSIELLSTATIEDLERAGIRGVHATTIIQNTKEYLQQSSDK